MGDRWTLAATNVHDISLADEAAGFMYAYDCGDGYEQFFTTSSFSRPTFETSR